MICSFCERTYFPPSRFCKAMMGKSFCGVDCLVQYVQQLPPWKGKLPELLARSVREAKGYSFTVSDYSIHSILLGQSFRSAYERDIAEVLIGKYGLVLAYEPFGLVLGPKNRQMYIPDFFNPVFGCLFEAKGDLRVGAKGKLHDAFCLLGEERFILIGPQYEPDFTTMSRSLRSVSFAD